MTTRLASTVVATELHQVVRRCGCSPEQKRAPDWHSAHGIECPNPLAVEDLGCVAASYRNPLKQLAWRLGRYLRGKKPGTASTPKE